jgi:hypothetical protein
MWHLESLYIILGISFMFVFAAYQTMGNVETTILKCACNQNSTGYVEDFSGSGYTSLAIIYAVLAFSNWFTPSLLSLIGPKVALIIGGLAYVFFISQVRFNEKAFKSGACHFRKCSCKSLFRK